jgi:two-component system alkaline phosphatase synthesis response regulator PhoP
MKTILVAEDDKFLSNAYRIKLVKLGYDVIIVSDGEQVMHYLHDNAVPDLLLLDLIMPVKDGFDTLREIKEKSGMKKFPIIVASNLGEGEDIKKAKELGAVDYIIKSDLSLQELADKIHSYLV